MVSSILLVSLTLAVFWTAKGQRTSAENSRCTFTFNVAAEECGLETMEDQLAKRLLVALQDSFRLLAEKQAEDIRKLTDENVQLRHEMSTIETGVVEGMKQWMLNIKQCSRRMLGDGKEYGLILSCQFVKKRGDTVLRVVWNGDMRLINVGPKGGSCRRWFFTINGQECSEPRTIDSQLHIKMGASNIHRPAHVEGFCRGVAAGSVNVAWNVGDCPNQGSYNVGDSATGWEATVRIIVEELVVEDADNVIV